MVMYDCGDLGGFVGVFDGNEVLSAAAAADAAAGDGCVGVAVGCGAAVALPPDDGADLVVCAAALGAAGGGFRHRGLGMVF